MDLRGGRAERAVSPSLPHHSLLMVFSAAARGGSSHRDHSLLRQLLMMKKIRATISSVSRTPAKKAKIKCSFLFWQKEGVGELLAGASWSLSRQPGITVLLRLSHGPMDLLPPSAWEETFCFWVPGASETLSVLPSRLHTSALCSSGDS